MTVPELHDIVERALNELHTSPSLFGDALKQLLSGPLGDTERNGTTWKRQPILLIFDDFERALNESSSDVYSVKADLLEVQRAVVRAFAAAATRSRVLWTCRSTFLLPDDGGADLFDRHLQPLPLPPMSPEDSRKQASSLLRLARSQTKSTIDRPDPDFEKRIVATAHGNAGLQALLFRLAIEARESCEDALQQTADHFATGTTPTHAAVVAFVEKLALDKLWALLRDDERQLLQVSTLFQLPVPLPILQSLADTLGIQTKAAQRLLSLGVWEQLPDPFEPTGNTTAVMANALLASRVDDLSDEDQTALAAAIIDDLLALWGGTAGRMRRGSSLDIELCRLGLLAGATDVVAATATDAINAFDNAFRYVAGADIGRRAVQLLNEHTVEPPLLLLKLAGELCVQTGDTPTARTLYQQALTQIGDSEPQDDDEAEEFAAIAISHSRLLAQDGKIDEALPWLERANKWLSRPTIRPRTCHRSG
ncbi:MAG: hypothetical protein R3C49_05695 [Planctomycetaceae bacterium]